MQGTRSIENMQAAIDRFQNLSTDVAAKRIARLRVGIAEAKKQISDEEMMWRERFFAPSGYQR